MFDRERVLSSLELYFQKGSWDLPSVKANGKLIRQLREKLRDGKKASQAFVANLSADRDALAKFKGEVPPTWINEFGNGWLSNVEIRSEDLFEENLLRSLAYILGVSFESITFAEYKNPYKGLQAFGLEDAEFFGGREEESQAVFRRLTEHSLVGIIGASGSGKSSLAFAGVLPLVQQDRQDWEVLSLRVGSKPLESLFYALDAWLFPNEQIDRPSRNRKFQEELREGNDALYHYFQGAALDTDKTPVLLIDQWEDLYTSCTDVKVRETFLRNIIAAIQGGAARILLTVRADFYGALQNSEPPFFELLKPNLIDLEPMSPNQLKAAIEKPIAKTGLQFDEGLIEQLLEAVGAEQGQLPILQFALAQLWTNRDRDRNQVTFETYHGLGGIKNVIKTHADDVIQNLDADAQRVAKFTLPRLVNLGEFGNDVKLRVPLANFSEEQQAVLRDLSGEESRLLSVLRSRESGIPNEEVEHVELVHEELIRSWPTLRNWINEDLELHQLLGRLRASHKQYLENDENPDFLIPQGKPLEDAKQLLDAYEATYLGELAPFVKRSIKKWTESKKRSENNRSRIRAALTVGLLVSISLSTLSFFQWSEAKSQFSNALQNEIRLLTAFSTTENQEGNYANALALSLLALNRSATARQNEAWSTPAEHQALIAANLLLEKESNPSLSGQLLLKLSDGKVLLITHSNKIQMLSREGHWIEDLEGCQRGSGLDTQRLDQPVLAKQFTDGTLSIVFRFVCILHWGADFLSKEVVNFGEQIIYASVLRNEDIVIVGNNTRIVTRKGEVVRDLVLPEPFFHDGLGEIFELPDGRFFQHDNDDRLWFWNLDGSLSEDGQFPSYPSEMITLPNGRLLFLGQYDVEIFDQAMNKVSEYSFFPESVRRMLLISENELMVSGYGNSFDILEIDDDRIAFKNRLSAHEVSIAGATVLSSGKLVTWDIGGVAIIWSANFRDVLAILNGHEDPIRDVIQLDDNSILTLSRRTAKLWSLEPFLLRGHTNFPSVTSGWFEPRRPGVETPVIEDALEPHQRGKFLSLTERYISQAKPLSERELCLFGLSPSNMCDGR